MRSYSKSIKKALHQWNGEAYERELHRELTRLDQRFAAWRRGDIGSGELAIDVHEFDSGPARELFKRYNDGMSDMNVAYAIVTGILDEGEAPAALVEALAAPLAFYRGLKERDELRYPDG
jgi:hypothetical protein